MDLLYRKSIVIQISMDNQHHLHPENGAENEFDLDVHHFSGNLIASIYIYFFYFLQAVCVHLGKVNRFEQIKQPLIS